MAVPDFQSLFRPLLEIAQQGEVRMDHVVDELGRRFQPSEQELREMVSSGKKTRFATRVSWARTYLKKAGLVEATKRSHIRITDRGREVLADATAKINTKFLQRYDEFRAFRSCRRITPNHDRLQQNVLDDDAMPEETPEEALMSAYDQIHDALSAELLERIQQSKFPFFEELVVELFLAMGYGGFAGDKAGKCLGRGGDGGVDGVIDQDLLGLDQIYIQAKRYADDRTVGAGAVRDFFGALSLKKADKGIFVTTSSFTADARQTAKDLGLRIVLVDGMELADLMIRYNIGCRSVQEIHLKKIDEDFFE